ncbi:MAG: hypothetical protein ABR511_12915 [Acidimicrobiales bacterium]
MRDHGAHWRRGRGLESRLEKMVAAGRVTEAEAAAVRAADAAGDAEPAIRRIQARHATEWINAAVDKGRLSRVEADEALARLDRGEDPALLRGLRHRRS